jgi:hypothetical protein
VDSPMIKPVDVGHEPHNPVRDDRRLAPTEDLDRQPDGVPHSIVGMTVGFSVVLALLVAMMFLSGSTAARFGAVLLVAIALPVLVRSLSRRSERGRDHLHPSR